LGISYDGMIRFLEMVGFICWAAEDEGAEDKYLSHKRLSWSYSPSYQRADKLASWLDPIVGPVQKDDSPRNNTGLKNIAGYDLCEFLRDWLKTEGYEELSVCEVILTQEPYYHLRPHVSRANIFWSHIQLEGLLGRQSTLSGIAYQKHSIDREERWKLPPQDEQVIWLDYFCAPSPVSKRLRCRGGSAASGGHWSGRCMPELLREREEDGPCL
jgi:hypothetical protein